ncbi:MAG TPA: hypothetical protein VFA37_06590 [Gaiellaceae bacterium]|nr:hypothetical protein [Gaiellaceae bacterium]
MSADLRSPTDESVPQSGKRWISDVPNIQVVSFILWICAEFALSLAAALAIEHRAARLPIHAQFSHHFMVMWAITWGGSILLLALLAGALVFRRTTPWDILLTWPWLVGPVVGAAFYFALTGQMHPGTWFCGRSGSEDACNFGLGIGSGLLSVAAAIVVGGTFISVASLKRFATRSR